MCVFLLVFKLSTVNIAICLCMQHDLKFPYALILNELIAHVYLVFDYNMLFVLLELSNTIVMTSVPSPTSAIRGFWEAILCIVEICTSPIFWLSFLSALWSLDTFCLSCLSGTTTFDWGELWFREVCSFLFAFSRLLALIPLVSSICTNSFSSLLWLSLPQDGSWWTFIQACLSMCIGHFLHISQCTPDFEHIAFLSKGLRGFLWQSGAMFCVDKHTLHTDRGISASAGAAVGKWYWKCGQCNKFQCCGTTLLWHNLQLHINPENRHTLHDNA